MTRGQHGGVEVRRVRRVGRIVEGNGVEVRRAMGRGQESGVEVRRVGRRVNESGGHDGEDRGGVR